MVFVVLLLAALAGTAIADPRLLPAADAAPVPLAAAPAADTRAADTPADDPVQVVVDQLDPIVPGPDRPLTVAGRLVNTTDSRVTELAVVLRVSTDPLQGRSDIADVVGGNDSHDGQIIGRATATAAKTLARGAQTDFRVTVPLDDLDLPRAGVYTVTVSVVGRRDGATDVQGTTRTFLPWFPQPSQVKPTRLVWLWPLATAPDRDAEGVLRSDRTATDLDAGGRLRTLLDLGRSHPRAVSWAVDPELTETAAAMSAGYRVEQPDGPEPGDAAAAAGSWLTDLQSAVAPPTTALVALPYADPDATALRGGGLERDVVRAVTLAPTLAASTLQRPVSGGVFWAPGGDVDAATLDTLAAAGVTTVVLSDKAMPPAASAAYTPSGSASLATQSGTVRAVLADSGLSAALAMPTRTRGQELLARQRFLAETAMITAELPGTQRTVVVAPPLRWAPNATVVGELLDAVQAAPWVTPATLSDLTAAAPSDVRRKRADPPPRSAALGATYVNTIAAQEARLGAFGEVVTDPVGLTDPYAAALLRTGSAAWREEPRNGQALLRTVSDQLAEQVGRVRVISKGPYTLSSETGVVPVTIANDLDQPVTVGVTMTGQPAARLSISPVEPVTIAPGRASTLEVTTHVVGSGPVPVSVRLTTAAGVAYSEPVEIEVRSTAYAQAARWVVGAAVAALAVLVAVNLVRRVRAGRRTAAAPPA
ncbi:MAG: hypothetical protein EPO13_05145 [Actinomycetota bacterium]|nr:MAG: hypothetical protein EPO13_05145 [Actinomycetota bacterium]